MDNSELNSFSKLPLPLKARSHFHRECRIEVHLDQMRPVTNKYCTHLKGLNYLQSFLDGFKGVCIIDKL